MSSSLALQYASALGAWVRDGDEGAKRVASELGRRALDEGLGILDVTALHEGALGSLGPDARAEAASLFLREALSPFDRALRDCGDVREQLRRANGELESFSHSVSHDLRAPLRSIDGFSQALLEDCAASLDEQGKTYLRFVRESAQEMARLIDDLLELSRASRAEIHRTPVDLTAIAGRIVEELRASDPARHVEVAIADGLTVEGDASLLTRVLESLLGNAWKFTAKREGARIEVGRRTVDGVAAWFVGDDGAGFDPRYAGKLFGAFQRLHAADEFGGRGIGLATVQRIVHRHGGRVWAEGEVDRGATFYFTLGERS